MSLVESVAEFLEDNNKKSLTDGQERRIRALKERYDAGEQDEVFEELKEELKYNGVFVKGHSEEQVFRNMLNKR